MKARILFTWILSLSIIAATLELQAQETDVSTVVDQIENHFGEFKDNTQIPELSLVVDQIDEGYVRVEYSGNHWADLPQTMFPSDIQEGDVFLIQKGDRSQREKEALNRLKRIKQRQLEDQDVGLHQPVDPKDVIGEYQARKKQGEKTN